MSSKKPSLDEMWKLINNIMRPNELVSDRSTLTYEQVFSIYSKLYEMDMLFKDIAQCIILKKALEEEQDNPIKA